MARNGSAPATGRRVVMFPFPSGGHTTPMLQLAALLRARGLAVTVLHADLNAPDPARHPDLAFVSIREPPLPDDVAANPEAPERAMAMNDACEAAFHAALADLLRGGGEVACAVVDGHWYKMLGAARRAGVPTLALRAGSAAALLAVLAAPQLRAAGYLPVTEDRLDEAVPGLEPLRGRDLIHGDGGSGDEEEAAALRFAACVADAMRASASAVVLNTFDAIEGPELDKVRRELSLPAFAVGPLHLLAPTAAAPAHAAADNRGGGCLAWLDAHPPRSVLFVSLGRAARIDGGAFEEMAWGLAGSGVPFLWALAPGTVAGAEDVPPFPEELHETLRRRGKVVAVAPPRSEVLAHRAVGGFLTRCGGWGAVAEAVCAGVPMLVQPCGGAGGDERVSARYVTHRWGTGLEVGKVFERTAMARAIRRLMARELGPQAPREKARVLKMQVRQCVAEGGPAGLAIDELVEYMLGL